MGYKYRLPQKSQLTNVKTLCEGEPIEHKIERIVNNKEPIKDGAPEIFTERKEGVNSAYNIRTDRWEIAAAAMDKVAGSIQAKRDHKGKVSKVKEPEQEEKGKVVELKADKKVSEAKSTEGTAGAK
jgi:hypothetical protein